MEIYIVSLLQILSFVFLAGLDDLKWKIFFVGQPRQFYIIDSSPQNFFHFYEPVSRSLYADIYLESLDLF